MKLLRFQNEVGAVARADQRKVTAVGRQNFPDFQSFCDGNHRGIHEAKVGIEIFVHHFDSSRQIFPPKKFHFHLSSLNRANELEFC